MSKEHESEVNHGDGDGGSWMGVMEEFHLTEQKARADRISRWAAAAGAPHAEIMLGDDPEYMERIGFWRVPGGVVRIRASKKGEFDPAERECISDKEAEAVAAAHACPPLEGGEVNR